MKTLALIVLLGVALRVILIVSERLSDALLDFAESEEGELPSQAVRVIDILACGLLALLVIAQPADCASVGSVPDTRGIRVPEASVPYRLRVEQAAAEFWGLDASPARLAAQLHQESAWNPKARSKYAHGLAQFTPATAAWLPQACPEVGAFDPWDAGQSIRAAACYDRWLYNRVSGASECDRWAFTLSAYNGGLGWVNRDRRLASATGADSNRWFGHVELYTSRALWAMDENREYVRRILLRIEPAYIAAGWSGSELCWPMSKRNPATKEG